MPDRKTKHARNTDVPGRYEAAGLPVYLKLREAADLLNVHPATLRRLVRRGVLPTRRAGANGSLWFAKSELMALLRQPAK